MEKRFELLPHTADIKICVYGSSLTELFNNALYGMFMSVEPLITSPAIECEQSIVITSMNVTILLIDFLSEALYLSAVHHHVYLSAVIQEITENSLKALLKGTAITGFAVTEIKAVTYHDAAVIKIDNQWKATIVFDI